MRVLFVAYASKAHFQAMVPLAWALRAAGDEVLVASQPELAPAITEAGLTAAAVGRDHNLWRSLDRFLSPRFARLRPEVHDVVRRAGALPFDLADTAPERITWEELSTAYDTLVRCWYRLANNTMLDDLVGLARSWSPDLVVWEPNTYVGAVAAKLVGAAHARLLWGMDIFAVTRARHLALKAPRPPDDRADPLEEWISSLIGRYGGRYSEDLAVGHFTIDQLPDALQMRADLRYVPMRYLPYNGPAVVPAWLRERPDRPRVALTLGLTSADHFGGHGLDLAETLDELAALNVEVVATVPDRERVKLGALPPQVRVVPFVALHALLPTCSAAIHHAGFGSLCSTLTYGVPPLCLPERFDEPALARRVADSGAGLALPMEEATGARVRQRVERLLREPSFGWGAGRLRADLLALPTPHAVARDLQKIVGEHRGG
jgi:glycosyltransferase (activator-dependent family)